jgi:hypothetical protein
MRVEAKFDALAWNAWAGSGPSVARLQGAFDTRAQTGSKRCQKSFTTSGGERKFGSAPDIAWPRRQRDDLIALLAAELGEEVLRSKLEHVPTGQYLGH